MPLERELWGVVWSLVEKDVTVLLGFLSVLGIG